MTRRRFQLATALLVTLASGGRVAHATRTLTLDEAVDLAMRSDPVLAETVIARDRAKNSELRSQLDRISVKVDGQLQELWNKSNIGGSKIYNCVVTARGSSQTFQTDATTCTSNGGVTMGLANEQAPSIAQGLFNLQAQVTVPVFSGLRVESTVSQRKKQTAMTLQQIRQQQKDLALSVARAYWAVRRLALIRDVQAEALARLRDAEKVTDARLQAGLAPPIDRNRATLRRLQQEATLADFAGQVREASVQLAVTLGVNEDIELVDNPTPSEQAPPSIESLLLEAKKGRPELAIARLQTEAQHYAVRIAQSNYYPQLGIFGLFQYGNNSLSVSSGVRSSSDVANPFSGLAGNLTLGAQLNMNFFDTLNTWTGTRDAKYEEARLYAEERRFGRVVESDVRQEQAKVEHLFTRRQPLLLARDVARDNLAILEGRYKNGDALVIEFLDAQVELSTAESNLADVTAQLYLAWMELSASLGQVVGARS